MMKPTVIAEKMVPSRTPSRRPMNTNAKMTPMITIVTSKNFKYHNPFKFKWNTIFSIDRKGFRMDKKLIIRYILLILGVTIMSLGIALSLKSTLGTPPISCIPAVLAAAFPFTVGEFTILFNALLVIFQMVLLRKVTLSQISQMLVCILFGYMIDFNLSLIDFINPTNYMSQWILLIISCLVLAFGLVIEVKSDITMLPGDGSVVAIGEVLNKDWGKVKPFFDVTIVIIGVILALVFIGRLEGVREGTIFSAVTVGFIIQFYNNLFGEKIDNYLEQN